MTTRKKATKKTLSRPSKAVKRPSKASASAKSKDVKAARPARTTKKTTAKSARAARVVSRAAPARSAARAKAKAERLKARRAAAAAKAAVKRKTAPASKTGQTPHAASPARERNTAGAPKKKVETVRKQPAPFETPAAAVASDAGSREPAKVVAAAPVAPEAAAPKPAKPAFLDKPASAGSDEAAARAARGPSQRQGFKTGEFIVYPAHGVGQIVAVEEQEVAGFRLELFVITFVKDKMTLRVPTGKVAGVGMRKLAEPDLVRKSLDILLGRARIKRTMWSRRAQEYEAKINSGDLTSIAEVVRDLYRSEAQPEQSYSERQLYEAALDRLAREVAVVQKLSEGEALKAIEAQLQKGQRRGPKTEAEPAAVGEADVEEAA